MQQAASHCCTYAFKLWQLQECAQPAALDLGPTSARSRCTHPTPSRPALSQEEKAKRAARAAKFGLQQPDPLAYAPDPEEIKKAERGAKFGTGYHADAALMDMGVCGGGSMQPMQE